MSSSHRAALINKTFKVLKKHYKPAKPPADRSLLEHLLYACCVENSPYEAADEAFAKLQQAFFDWNEIRVTTIAELAETMSCLPDPSAAATRLKRCLQGVFETHYAFDIEILKKQNLGKAIEQLEKLHGITPFVVAYVAQNGLGGHSIPTSQGALDVLEVVGLISDVDAKKQRVPGLERTVSKSKGVEFASLLHQLGADFFASPWGAKVRSILVEIEPQAKDRLPKRSVKPEHPPAPPPQQRGPATLASPPPDTAESPADTAKRKKGAKPAEAAGKSPADKSEKKTGKDASKEGVKEADREAEKEAAQEQSADKRSTTKQLTRKKPR